MFNAIAQMTPYGIYNLKYTNKSYSSNSAKKSLALTKDMKAYNSIASSSLPKNYFSHANVSNLQSEYKKEIFSALSSARALSESAKHLLEESWPKAKLEAPAGVTAQFAESTSYETYNVEGVEIAQNHSFKTNELFVSQATLIDKGTYSVIIEKDNKQQKIAFTLKDNASVRETVYKLADAINSFSKDVYAETHAANDLITLRINASVAGQDGRFSIADDTGSVLQKLGLYSDTQGKDGVVRIDGVDYFHKDNTVVLDNGKVNLHFTKQFKGKINVVPDTEQSVYAIKALVNNYNNFARDFSKANNVTDRAKEMFALPDDFFTLKLDTKEGLFLSNDSNLFVFNEQACKEYLNANPLAIEKIKDGDESIASILYDMADGVTQNPLSTYFSSPAVAGNESLKFSGIVLDLLA